MLGISGLKVKNTKNILFIQKSFGFAYFTGEQKMINTFR